MKRLNLIIFVILSTVVGCSGETPISPQTDQRDTGPLTPRGTAPFKGELSLRFDEMRPSIVCRDAAGNRILSFPQRAEGGGSVSHLGKVTIRLSADACSVSDVGFMRLNGYASLENVGGHVVHLDFRSLIDSEGKLVRLQITVVGGTGRFEGVSGNATGTGGVDLSAGEAWWSFYGWMTIPRSTEGSKVPWWSIGLYEGRSPFALGPSSRVSNPVLTAQDVTDARARYVADPFMLRLKSQWYMFFEIFNEQTNHGDIALATSRNGIHWDYQQLVLDEPFHLSYPYIFEWDGEYYMVPETYQSQSIRLYRAVRFPTDWAFVQTLIQGVRLVDPSVFRFKNYWWMFAATQGTNDTLRLYYAQQLIGPWFEHPKSPVIAGDPNVARPGGRVLVFGERVIRFAQDDYPLYGSQVWAFEITTLTTSDYQEMLLGEDPVLTTGISGWNRHGMHHIDPHQVRKRWWIACVDGINRPGLGFDVENRIDLDSPAVKTPQQIRGDTTTYR